MLKFAITDLAGNQRAAIFDYVNALVTVPYNDSRTAGVTISADNPAVAEVAALERMLKVWYVWPDGTAHLIFWGPIMTPTWSASSTGKTLTIDAHDMSIRLKHHYLSGADTSIFSTDPATITADYEGLRALRTAAKNAAAENTAGVPDLGIGDGTNTHPGAYAVTFTTADASAGDTNLHVLAPIGFPASEDDASHLTVIIDSTHDTSFDYTAIHSWGFSGLTPLAVDVPAGSKVIYNVPRQLKVSKGDEIYQRWQDVSGDPFGPDFRLRPDDSTDGIYALLDTFDKLETSPGGARDKRFEVMFQAGFGMENVETFSYAPQGDALRNRAVVQQSHTASDGTGETTSTKIETNLPSRQKYGNYVSWETLDSDLAVDLKGKAEATLLAYSEPPQQFSLTPRSDETQRFIFGRDYQEGDVISAAAHFGQLRIWLPGFIHEARVKQLSSSGRTQVELDVLPEIVSAGDLDNG